MNEDVIFEQGSVGDCFYFVESGNVSVVSTNGKETKKVSGIPVELTVLGPGAYFGERALIYDEGRTASCIAKGATTVWRLSRWQFDQILGSMLPVLFPGIKKRRKFATLKKKKSCALPPSICW